MTQIIPPGASDAASPDLSPEERTEASASVRPRREMTREEYLWVMYGVFSEEEFQSRYAPPTGLARLQVRAHKAVDGVFEFLKRLV
jgi:hypothetical protein